MTTFVVQRATSRWWSPMLLLLMLCIYACDVRAQLFGLPAAECNCNCTAVQPTGNRTVNVAMLFWGPPASDERFAPVNGNFRVVWPRNPLLDGWTGPTALETMFLRAYLIWEERMALPAKHGGGPGLIMLDGSVLRFNLTWFHAGVQSDYAELGSDEYSEAYQSSWANTLVKQLANVSGPYGRQHFLLSPLQGNEVVTLLTSLACEASGTCLVVSPSAIEARLFICKEPMPFDCLQRKRRINSRRFEYTVSAASNGDYWASGCLDLLANQGVKCVYVIAESWSVATIAQLRSTAKELGVAVLGVQMIDPFSSGWDLYNTSASAVTAHLQSLAPDMLIVISSGENAALLQLLRHFQSIDYLPHAVAYLAGGAASLPRELSQFFLVENTWLQELTGESYRAELTPSNFEAFPANSTHDSPAVFADAYEKRFQIEVPDSLFFQAARALHATTIVQKLLEHSQSEETASLQQSAARIAMPGAFHEIQFEQWGRSLPFDNFVLQLMPDGRERILTPLGLGSDPILPMPLWSEREYSPHFLRKISDRLAFAFSAVAVAYLLGWLIWIVSCWHHPVLRISDPLFSALSLIGLIVLASSNFFSTFQEDNTSCTASTCMFWYGLTLGFAPLVLKNLRIWSLWHNRSNTFAPAPIKQWHLGLALVGLLLVDLAINLAWAFDTGMRAVHVRLDPWRPSLDYGDCTAFVDGRRYLAAHIAVKAVCLAAGMWLAYLLRNVSATYSESRFIALSVYNVVVVLAVLLPIVSIDMTAGHEGTILVRNYLVIFLCVSTASIMCVPKYAAVRTAEAKKRADIAAAHKAGMTLSSSDGGALTLPPPPKDGPPLKSALKPARAGQGANASALGTAGIEMQSVHDTHFQSGIGLSAVARAVDDQVSNTNTEAPSSMLYAPHPPLMSTRPPGAGRPQGPGRKDPPRSNAAAGASGDATNRAPLLPTIIQSPTSLHMSMSHTSVGSVSLLRAAYDLLESTSDDDLSTDELVRLHSSLGQRVARRMNSSASGSSSQPQSAMPASYQTARRSPPQQQSQPQHQPPPQYHPRHSLAHMASFSSSGSSGSSSSFGASSFGTVSSLGGSYLPDTPHPAPPSGRVTSSLPPVSSSTSHSGDGSPASGSPHPLLPPAASHVVCILPDPALTAASSAAAASAVATTAPGHRDRTPSSKKRTPSSKRVFRSDMFDTDIVSFHME